MSDLLSSGASEELFAPVGDGVELCYQTFGDPSDPPLLLVMGLGGPMNWWDAGLCRLLARRGFYVIRYDNRDTGRSTKGTARVGLGQIVRAFVGALRNPPYRLDDLADDAFGLLDHLGLTSAHVVGVSMGGMIAQTMALAHPERVRSLVSIMSTTGRRTVGWVSPRVMPRMLAAAPRDRATYIERYIEGAARIGSPAYPEPPDDARRRGGETWDRGINPPGTARQMVAVLAQADRTRRLRRLRLPAAVVHGTRDRMVHVTGGKATAKAIPGAELNLIDGMGHDLPEPLWDTFADVIRRTADRAG